jgi:hypothetical protein
MIPQHQQQNFNIYVKMFIINLIGVEEDEIR